MKQSFLTIIICVMMCLIVVAMMFFVLGLHDRTVESVDKPVDKSEIVCEHDWVAGSQYSYWTNIYRTVSKCSKCGKVVK